MEVERSRKPQWLCCDAFVFNRCGGSHKGKGSWASSQSQESVLESPSPKKKQKQKQNKTKQQQKKKNKKQKNKKTKKRAGEMAQWLRALTALPEDLSSNPAITWWLTTICNGI